MKIYNGDVLIVDTGLNQKDLCIECAVIGFNDVLIEYMDKELLSNLSVLITDVVSQTQPEWKFADYKNTKTYIYIAENNDGYDYRMSIEILPPRYSSEYISSVLERVSNVKLPDDIFTEKENWIEIFHSAQKFYENNEDGEIWSYPLELSEEERNKLNMIAESLIS